MEPPSVIIFREWLTQKGAYLHPAVKFVENTYGMSVCAAEYLPSESKVVSCPFSLAITPDSSKKALEEICRDNGDIDLEILSDRELVCTYIVMHWLREDGQSSRHPILQRVLDHMPYINTLPRHDTLRTPLHFTESELSVLRGTNLYGATEDRKFERKAEWMRCRSVAAAVDPSWEEGFSWDRYLTAATYLSSRAFPSTLLSRNPSLLSGDSSYPILLPGVDSLNHARAYPVSWVIDPLHPTLASSSTGESLQISLVVHTPTPSSSEIFNNYGPKPNSELILGYGFSLLDNPDDTIVLKLGGLSGNDSDDGCRWEVGRDAKGAEKLWDGLRSVFSTIMSEVETPNEWEVDMEAAETLKNMVEQKIEALPDTSNVEDVVREDVLEMIRRYIQGQRDILQSLIGFSETKIQFAVAKAKEEGVNLVFEEDELDST